MNLFLKQNEIRRCRPLLGTFVEVVLECETSAQGHAACEAAFAAIERVHNLMSFHDKNSEVSKLNRFALRHNVPISLETYQVLKYAKELHQLTQGAFDITVASELMDWGLLPRHEFLCRKERFSGTTTDIQLLANGSVRFSRPLCIDLGGIAKGFAVDQAIEALQRCGLEGGLVNAGGDLRCFGEKEPAIWVRHPQDAGKFFSLPAIRKEALATSANFYDWQKRNSNAGAAQVNGQTKKPLKRPFSVSVRADSCLRADALTKVVFAWEEKSTELLFNSNAQAFIINPDHTVISYGRRNS